MQETSAPQIKGDKDIETWRTAQLIESKQKITDKIFIPPSNIIFGNFFASHNIYAFLQVCEIFRNTESHFSLFNIV